MKYKNIISILLAVIMVAALLLSGCKKAPETAADTLDVFLTALQEQDKSTAEKYYTGDSDKLFYFDHNKVTGGELTKDQEETAEAVREKLAGFQYTLGTESMTEDGDTAIEVSIKAYDFEDYMTDALSDVFDRTIQSSFDGDEETLDKADVFAALNDYLFELNSLTDAGTITMTLKKSGDTWTVQPLTEDDLNTLSGGAYAMLKGLDSLQN